MARESNHNHKHYKQQWVKQAKIILYSAAKLCAKVAKDSRKKNGRKIPES